MATALDTYKRTVGEQLSCDDAWFPEALDRARAGETEARGRICGSCLRIALTAAERRWDRRSEQDLFDLVEEANAAVAEAVTSFTGSGAGEFLHHVEGAVTRRLDGLE